MNKVMIAALAALLTTGAAQADTSVLVFGKSHHFHTEGRDYNETNLGGGVEWKPADSGFLVGGFAVKDSMRKLGGAAYVGYRARYEFDSGVHVEATLRGGYLKDANFKGLAALPSVGVGYKNVTLEMTFLPKLSQTKSPAAVAWLRIDF